jgi:cell division protein FtsI (penicillin-binding protein 3)
MNYACLGCAMIIKAALIQVKEGPKLRAMAKEMHTRFDTLLAERGNIYNERGCIAELIYTGV